MISAAADAEGGSRRASHGARSSQLLQQHRGPRVGSPWGTAGRDPSRDTDTSVSAAQSWLKLQGFGAQLEPLRGEDSNPAPGARKDWRGPLRMHTAVTTISTCFGAKKTLPGIPEQGRGYSPT